MGYSLDKKFSIVLSVSVCDLSLSFRLSVTGKQSISCVCSKKTFVGGMVCFTTGLTWFSVFSAVCFVFIGVLGSIVDGVRVRLTTIVVIVVANTICIVWPWSLSFELILPVSVVTWIFAMMTSWFGFSWNPCVACCVSVLYLQLI